MKKDSNIYKNPISNVILTGVFFLCAIMFTACETDLDKGTYPNESEPMIDEFLEERADLSSFWTIVQKADMKGVVHAYGTYTCFAPNNEAVEKYLNMNGLTMDALTEEEAEHMVRYHLVNDTLSTADFNESRLDVLNMAKHYISTKTDMDEEDNVIIRVNRDAVIVDANNHLGNGYVHVIDGFLARPNVTVEETVMNMPDEEFSMMKSLLLQIKEKYDASISDYIDSDTTYLTFLSQTNEAFEKVEIFNLDSLLVRLRDNDLQSAYTDTELVKNWLGYHCLQGRIYMKDILESSNLKTQVDGQVITISMVLDSIFLNRFKTDYIDEDGIRVVREGEYVDYLCKDGVIQTALDELEFIERAAYRVYWDMADQPEIRALKGYQKGGTYHTFQSGDLSGMRWSDGAEVHYVSDGIPEVNGSFDIKGQYIYADYLQFRLCTTVMPWMEVDTPVLVPGKYKIWLCWRRYNHCKFKTTLIQDGEEDQVLLSVVDLWDSMPNNNTDPDVLEAQGWKQYNARVFSEVMCSKNLGIIEIKKTGSHILRFDATISSGWPGVNWDMIQFIPIDEDQVWPRMGIDGSYVYKGTHTCMIFPNDGSNCEPVEGEE